ncbi:MAG: hypothetical protein IPP63_20635 [Chloracidobacterium sp.]|nr:hypothetical protein [Chloracidobacterium sp.]
MGKIVASDSSAISIVLSYPERLDVRIYAIGKWYDRLASGDLAGAFAQRKICSVVKRYAVAVLGPDLYKIFLTVVSSTQSER